MQENELLNQKNTRLQTANTEMESANRQLSEKIKTLSSELEEALYDFNIQKQKNVSLEKSIEGMNQQLELQKTGSSSEIGLLLKELQATRNDLIQREDKLREAEKTLEDKNARLIELQDILDRKSVV